MAYEVPRSTRIVSRSLLAAAILSLLAWLNWQPIKEVTFHAVLSRCEAWHRADPLVWFDVPVFDVAVRRTEAVTAGQLAVVRCTNRWTGLLIDDLGTPAPLASEEALAVLQTEIRGDNYAPPQRLFDAFYVEFARAAGARRRAGAQ